MEFGQENKATTNINENDRINYKIQEEEKMWTYLTSELEAEYKVYWETQLDVAMTMALKSSPGKWCKSCLCESSHQMSPKQQQSAF